MSRQTYAQIKEYVVDAAMQVLGDMFNSPEDTSLRQFTDDREMIDAIVELATSCYTFPYTDFVCKSIHAKTALTMMQDLHNWAGFEIEDFRAIELIIENWIEYVVSETIHEYFQDEDNVARWKEVLNQ